MYSNCLFFSLLHQRADKALTKLLHTSLFLVASPILVKSMFSHSDLNSDKIIRWSPTSQDWNFLVLDSQTSITPTQFVRPWCYTGSSFLTLRPHQSHLSIMPVSPTTTPHYPSLAVPSRNH